MMVPIGKRMFEAGNRLRNPKHAKKKAGRERFQSNTTTPTLIAMTIHPVQSATLPLASGISEYE